MRFESDPRKSEANAEKHGIDFEEAQALWDDPWLQVYPLSFKGERRMVALARHAGSCWAAVFTMRGDRVRPVSVRRATPKEASAYDRTRNDR